MEERKRINKSTPEGCQHHIHNMNRQRITREYENRGLKLCHCGTPIRSPIFVDPCTGSITEKRGGVRMEIHLTRICEVCWREGGDIVEYGLSLGKVSELELVRCLS